MARITIQMGHCFRTTGKTGGPGEQTFAKEVADRLKPLLEERGHQVQIVEADTKPFPAGDVFVALHTDGSPNTSVRGASVGFPDENGKRLAHAWKRAHQRAGFAGGFRADNNTVDQREYYGFGRAAASGHTIRFLAEHGMHSNAAEFDWLHSNFDACADAHVAAISEVVGDVHPMRAPGPSVPVGAPPSFGRDIVELYELGDGSVIMFGANGSVRVDGNQAHMQGSREGLPMNAPVVGAAMSDDEMGYWLVGADGGIFTFNTTVIQPYTPLFQEFAAGVRRIVRARRHGAGLLLISNLGERYSLQPVIAGRRFRPG